MNVFTIILDIIWIIWILVVGSRSKSNEEEIEKLKEEIKKLKGEENKDE